MSRKVEHIVIFFDPDGLVATKSFAARADCAEFVNSLAEGKLYKVVLGRELAVESKKTISLK